MLRAICNKMKGYYCPGRQTIQPHPQIDNRDSDLGSSLLLIKGMFHAEDNTSLHRQVLVGLPFPVVSSVAGAGEQPGGLAYFAEPQFTPVHLNL